MLPLLKTSLYSLSQHTHAAAEMTDRFIDARHDKNATVFIKIKYLERIYDKLKTEKFPTHKFFDFPLSLSLIPHIIYHPSHHCFSTTQA
jgi:hypothetical protein